jgi:glycosyltransferase involved in cell wall biosynthesis
MIQLSDILDSPAYIINLDVATDRFVETNKNIKDAGFTYIERVSGIHASEIGDERLSTEWTKHGSPEFKKDGIPEILLDVHIGRKGIMLSQLHIWKMISEMENVDDNAYFTIFEDDVIFHSEWKILAPYYYLKTPKDFDILFIGQLSLRKGLPYLLDAFNKFKHPFKKLHLIGLKTQDFPLFADKINSENTILNVLGLSTPVVEINNSLEKTIILETIFYDINVNPLNLSIENSKTITIFQVLSQKILLKIKSLHENTKLTFLTPI